MPSTVLRLYIHKVIRSFNNLILLLPFKDKETEVQIKQLSLVITLLVSCMARIQSEARHALNY